MNDEYADWLLSSVPSELPLARKIVYGIIFDLTDRRGLRQVWDGIDDEVKEEIIESWVEIVEESLSSN